MGTTGSGMATALLLRIPDILPDTSMANTILSLVREDFNAAMAGCAILMSATTSEFFLLKAGNNVSMVMVGTGCDMEISWFKLKDG